MYNPYDMIPMVVNGEETVGRPVEFDSQITDFETMENAFGNAVKPSKVTTTCPRCGQGLEVFIKLLDPPFSPVHYNCEYCTPVEPEIHHDPFSNPIETGRMSSQELDPLLYNLREQVVPSEGSVADNWSEDAGDLLASLAEEAPGASTKDTDEEIDQDLVAALAPKKSKKKRRKSKSKTKIEPADGLDEEIFDDSDLADE